LVIGHRIWLLAIDIYTNKCGYGYKGHGGLRIMAIHIDMRASVMVVSSMGVRAIGGKAMG
jgi:hypothetical protein